MSIIKQLRVLLSAETDGFKKGFKDSRQALTDFKSELNNLITGAVSIGAMTKFLMDSSKAADEAAKVQGQLNAVIRSTGGVAGVTADDVNGLASEISRLTGVEDDSIIKAQALLLTFTSIGRDVFPDATRAAVDMSAALGQSLQSSVTMLGKALQDPIRGATALRRVGVNLSEEQENLIRNFVKMNDLASAQGVILQELQVEFGGTAQAIGDASVGMEKLQNAYGNVQEGFGEFLNTAMKPTIAAWTDFFDELSQGIEIENDLNDAVAKGLLTYDQATVIINKMSFGVITEAEARQELTQITDEYTASVEMSSDAGMRAVLMHNDMAAAANSAAEATERVAIAINDVTSASLGKEAVDALNQAYKDGVISEAEYEQQMRLVMGSLLDMSATTIQAQIEMQNLKQDLESGKITATGFVGQVRALDQSLANLDGKRVQTYIEVYQIQRAHAIEHADDPDPYGNKPGLASGGPVKAGQPYWVGEMGPEPFVPAQNGYVLNREDAMAALGGGMQIGQVVINAQPGQDGRALFEQFKRAMEQEQRARSNAGAAYAGR